MSDSATSGTASSGTGVPAAAAGAATAGRGRAAAPDPAAQPHFFEAMAEHMGEAYLRYSFTKGTDQEVAFLWEQLGLAPGMRVLDVGCGPGRHSLALARRGVEVVGIDIAARFVELATAAAQAEGLSATFTRGDARALTYDREFDAVLSLCQGGFGLLGRVEDGAADLQALTRMGRAVKAGGHLALSAFSAYFQVRHLEDTDTFDANLGVNHERTEIRAEQGAAAEFDLWTTCFTPRELRLMCTHAGLTVEHLWSVRPGEYGPNAPDVDHPEFLLITSAEGIYH